MTDINWQWDAASVKRILSAQITHLSEVLYNIRRGNFMAIPNVHVPNFKTDDPARKTFLQQAYLFESRMFNTKSSYCTCCKRRRLGLVVGVDGLCKFCMKERDGFHLYSEDNKALPVWYDKKGRPHYDIPAALKELTLAEQMLIQRISPYIPVIHIKNGTLGSRGHTVSFIQDITGICKEFPRLPEDVVMVKITRTQVTPAGENISRTFTVRRDKILRALSWLKAHNPLYADIDIKPENLDWMEGNNEADLPVISMESMETEDEDPDR